MRAFLTNCSLLFSLQPCTFATEAAKLVCGEPKSRSDRHRVRIIAGVCCGTTQDPRPQLLSPSRSGQITHHTSRSALIAYDRPSSIDGVTERSRQLNSPLLVAGSQGFLAAAYTTGSHTRRRGRTYAAGLYFSHPQGAETSTQVEPLHLLW